MFLAINSSGITGGAAALAFAGLIVSAIACGGGGKQQKSQIVFYAAASTMELMTAAAEEFHESTGIEVGYEFASSGSLARKIETGSPTDIFISANERWIEYAERKKLVDGASQLAFARNSLVCVEPLTISGEIDSPEGLLKAERLSIGDPEHVPAGQYAKQALEYHGLWDKLVDGEKIVLAPNVSAALRYVEQADVSAGIVYATDAARSSKVRTVFTFDESSHKPITYHAAIVSASSRKQEAARFMQFLSSGEFLAILEKYGFKRP